MLIGLLMVWKGWLKSEGRNSLSILITHFALPCAVFNSFQIPYSPETLDLILRSLVVAALFFLLLYLMSIVFTTFFKISNKLRTVWIGCCTFSSVLFIGIPIVNALFGELGLVILISFNTIGNLFLFGLGESIFAGKLLVEPKKLVTAPAIIAAIFGFICFMLKIETPAIMSVPVQTIASFTTPLAMIINGALLSENLSIKRIINLRVFQFCTVRLILIPIVLISFFQFILTDALIVKIVSLIACMPSGAVNSVFAEKYSGQGGVASEFIISSTLYSIVTIPIVFNFFF